MERGYNTQRYVDLMNDFTKNVTGGICLHLGCGSQFYEGWTNVDKYYADDVRVLQLDIADLPYEDGQVDKIYSSHSLEHLPIRKQIPALRKWVDFLKTDGELLLAVPDLKRIFKIMLDDGVDMMEKIAWWRYTLFGFQISSEAGITDGLDQYKDHDQDLGQFHYGGFTEEMLRYVLQDKKVDLDIFEYDGWSTPSLCMKLKKLE